jgi:SAM-dependent methyltransferase
MRPILPFGKKLCSSVVVRTGSAVSGETTKEQVEMDFDKDYWDEHWEQRPHHAPGAHPYLGREISGLKPGTALDAGCGAGAEAVWLATQGWQVTAADIAPEALARAAERAAGAGLAGRVRFVEADLTAWAPATRFDLVTTHYAHPAMAQLDFYERIGAWVAPGGTLLIVGHLHAPDAAGHGHHPPGGHGHQPPAGHTHQPPAGEEHHPPAGHEHQPPAEASVTLADVTARFDGAGWEVVTAEEHRRAVTAPDGREVPLRDVVVRATRRS